ncbi:MAG TPA: penicillin-binding protein 2, partial [Desulfobacterales bacterium]|nr:penicillin-binding protein 2 [Desulfobacterales bacterium]
WQGGETLSVAIGQGFDLVTPIQALGLISAVANGGIRYKPLVVRRIESSEGSLVKKEVPVPLGRISASDKTLHIVKRGLLDAVNKPTGTGWIARIAGINMAGKTGTAQVVRMEEDDKEQRGEDKHLHFRDHAWFIAFAPAEEPKIAVAVLIEHGGHGSTEAGPVAREMIKTYLRN